MAEQESVKSLNQLLQGEHMAVDSLNVFISKTEDEDVKKALQHLQNHHRENIAALAKYIQSLGGKPQENLGMKGIMAETMLNLEFGKKADSVDIIEKVIEGETKGINMAEKVLRGALDDESRRFVEKIRFFNNMVGVNKITSTFNLHDTALILGF
jgi:bacterioferritin